MTCPVQGSCGPGGAGRGRQRRPPLDAEDPTSPAPSPPGLESAHPELAGALVFAVYAQTSRHAVMVKVRARQPSPVDSWCGALLVEPGSSHQSGDRAAHMRLGAPEPPAQGPLRDPTPGPDRTPDPRTVSKSATKAVAVPMRRRQNRGITRFRLSHPDRAAAFVADLDNHRPHLGHPQPGRTRDPAAHDPQRARARPTPRTASTCSA